MRSGNRFRSVPGPQASGLRSLERYRAKTRLSTRAEDPAHVARELVICLGWFRLFRTILSPGGGSAARCPFLRELQRCRRSSRRSRFRAAFAGQEVRTKARLKKTAVQTRLEPSTGLVRRRLPISLWEARFWTKKISEVRAGRPRKVRPLRRSGRFAAAERQPDGDRRRFLGRSLRAK